MTPHDALLILDLSAPITREMLNKAYEDGVKVWRPESFAGSVSLQAKAAAKTEQLFKAYSLLFDQPDDAFPFQGKAQAGAGMGMTRASRPGAVTVTERQPMEPQHAEPEQEAALEQQPMDMEPQQQARPMPRAMKPRPRQPGEMPLQEMPRDEVTMPDEARTEMLPPAPPPAPPQSQMQPAQRPATPPLKTQKALPPLILPTKEPETPKEHAAMPPLPGKSQMDAGAAPRKEAGKLPPLPQKAPVAQGDADALPGLPAPFLYRAGAWLIDFFIFSLFMTVTGMGALHMEVNKAGPWSQGVILQLLACVVFSLLYSVVLESSATQATLGKKACGLVVTDLQGRRISVARATGRFFARLLSWPLTLGLGYLLGAVTRKRQCLHDLVAQCLVRRAAPESAGVAPGELPDARTPRVLIYLGVGVVAAMGMVGYVYYLNHQEIGLPGDAEGAERRVAVGIGDPILTEKPGAENAVVPAAPGTTTVVAWKQVLPLADVQALAAKGDVQAQTELAFAYAGGEGVTKNLQTAAEWLRKAAASGDAFAQYHLGYAYRMGEGVTQNNAEAARWYFLAAEQGQALAQMDLANLYFKGEGVAKDDAASVKWMRKAAEQNEAEAQDSLGSAYQYGVGMEKNPAEAVQWYRKAAAQRYGLAYYHLGVCYEDGEGVTQDLVEALMWYIAASAYEGPEVMSVRKALESRMTQEQRLEATERGKKKFGKKK
jgi:TPR repeat protein/uncharacterized RDD family membrane protein YckC